jgi:MSHA biogenesis protein MshQ
LIAAGDPFAATVTVFDAEGDITPNYGQESGPETVQLSANLVDPAAGSNPPISATAGFGPFVNGQATGNDFVWPEVGIITLRPSVGDGTYFDAGDVAGYNTMNVGRFLPHHFTTSLNTPEFATGCPSGSYTYIGQDFGYSVVPVATFTARAAGGATTQNYAGVYFKIDNISLGNRAYTAAVGSLDTSGLPPTTADPVPVSLGAGVGTLTFSAGSGLLFNRGAPESAFDAQIELSIDVIDADGVVALTNPVIFGDPGGITFDNGAGQRYGRIRLINALGSELVNLNVPMRAEYFVNNATGFVANTSDSCTGGVNISLSTFTKFLALGETCVLDSGAPGNSGAGCATPAAFGLRFRDPPLGSDFNLNLKAPGTGNSGSVKVTADVPGWLKFDWDIANPGLEEPIGTATFGIFDGEDRQIYMREIY